MNINSVYASRWLRATSLNGKTYHAIIVAVEEAGVNDHGIVKRRAALKLASSNGVLWPKALLLNATNAKYIAQFLGPETSAWTGRVIEIYPTMVPFGNELTEAIRVRFAPEHMPAAPAPAAELAPPAMPPAATPTPTATVAVPQ